MKDEIKEILDKLKDSVNYPIIDVPTMDGTDSEPMENIVLLEPNESKIILDCITNLQEENERLDMVVTIQENYKSRNEKAIKELKDTSVDMPSTLLIEVIDYAIHILQGSDKDE